MTKETLKLALEALEESELTWKAESVIKALEEALKQEQELDYKAIGQQAYESGYTTGYMDGAIKAHEAKQEQGEPVAITDDDGNAWAYKVKGGKLPPNKLLYDKPYDVFEHLGYCPECGATKQEQDEPKGWRLVPIKPTLAMIDALADTDPEHESVWEAVLSVAPQPKQEQDEPVAEKVYDQEDDTAYIQYFIPHELIPIGTRFYTKPQPSQKPLTEDIWILTSEYNDYDQHGEYFEAVFIGKPTAEQIKNHCEVNELGSAHILAGGGRVKSEDHWYNLRKEEAAHGIKE